jgi:hypothetical protein
MYLAVETRRIKYKQVLKKLVGQPGTNPNLSPVNCGLSLIVLFQPATYRFAVIQPGCPLGVQGNVNAIGGRL